MKGDFDNIFKDKIGDELPFDFRPNDWLAAEQELDKLMPIAAPVAPSPRFLTWHKWAIAATVLLLGSQLFLMSELGKVKQEVTTLHEENKALVATTKKENQQFETPQSVVIQHDTFVKTVFVETPSKEKTFRNSGRGAETQRLDLDNYGDNKNSIQDRNEAVLLNQKSSNAQNPKLNLATNKNELNVPKTPLQTVENTVKKEANTAAKINELNSINNGIIKNELVDIKKENATNLVDNKTENKDNLVAINNENDTKLIENNLINNKKEITVLNALPNTQLTAVKSINRTKNWLNEDAFDFLFVPKPVIIKPISVPNGWEIGVNSLFLTNEEHRRPKSPNSQGPKRNNHGEERLSTGLNVRLTYNLNRAIRLSADADFWGERHGKFDPNALPQNQPINLPDHKLTDFNQSSRSIQLRLGADYKLRQVFGLQSFIGLGAAYQMRSVDNLEYDYTTNNGELPTISTPNDVKFDKPFSLSLRAGVEGKIYRRLSWSINLDAQKGATNRQTFSSHFGLKYAL
jgi:hypothetical protein